MLVSRLLLCRGPLLRTVMTMTALGARFHLRPLPQFPASPGSSVAATSDVGSDPPVSIPIPQPRSTRLQAAGVALATPREHHLQTPVNNISEQFPANRTPLSCCSTLHLENVLAGMDQEYNSQSVIFSESGAGSSSVGGRRAQVQQGSIPAPTNVVDHGLLCAGYLRPPCRPPNTHASAGTCRPSNTHAPAPLQTIQHTRTGFSSTRRDPRLFPFPRGQFVDPASSTTPSSIPALPAITREEWTTGSIGETPTFPARVSSTLSQEARGDSLLSRGEEVWSPRRPERGISRPGTPAGGTDRLSASTASVADLLC